MASSKTITLISSDDETFDLDVVAAMESQLIKGMIEDGCADNAIPVPNVTSKVLAKVIEYCKKHVETPEADEHAVNDELKAWDADFVKVDLYTLYDLINAANYLEIKSLLDLTCQTLSDMIKGKTPEEINKMFKIESAFTPEEEEQIRREDQRAFETGDELAFETGDELAFKRGDELAFKSLLGFTCQTVVDMIKGLTLKEISKIFVVKNDFTPEEKEEVWSDDEWVFE